ncbi:MAG: PadR family transcriptional regulator [Mobilitalea sp.]
MYLEILILSQLLDTPRHAYEIRTNINNMVVFYLNINNNTLYPLMRRIEQEGYVTRKLKEQTDRPNKYIYQITEAGRVHFKELLCTFSEKEAIDDMEFYTRVVLFKYLQSDEIQIILKTREECLIKKQLFYDRFDDTEFKVSSNINHEEIKSHLNAMLDLELKNIQALSKKWSKNPN